MGLIISINGVAHSHDTRVQGGGGGDGRGIAAVSFL